MKRLNRLLLLTIALCFLVSGKVFAADDVARWKGGGGDTNWSTAANWESGHTPKTTDIVYFGPNSKENCSLDQDVTVAGLIIGPGYDGTIDCNGKSLMITKDFIK